jgi:outer membrane lipoprotein-sorting protein
MMQFRPSGRFWSTLGLALSVLLALSGGACQPAPKSNANSNTQPEISRAILANPNSESATSGITINAREPEKYSATLQLSIETAGSDKAAGTPSLSVQVARNGSDRRFEFKLPDGTPLIYLDHNNRHYVIVTARKQYAELTAEATGEQMEKLMTPDQIVEDLKGLTGVERAGEGPVNGRVAEKYRYSAADKNAKAADAKTEAFIYVDKETGLPLRAEKLPRRWGDKGGITTRAVIEMRDLKTDIEASLFEVPAGYAQVAPEKLRQQIDALTGELAAALKTMMANASNPAASPAASVSPKPN